MKKLSPERLSHYILYVLIGITVVVFLAFYLTGTEPASRIYDENSAPVLVSFLIGFLIFMIILAAVAAIVMLLRTLFMRGK